MFKVTFDKLAVGFNGGLWNIAFQDIGGKHVQTLTVTLHTPVKSVICTGFESGLQFSNCIAGPDKVYRGTPDPRAPMPANATFTGYASGVGPGSAKIGQTYTVTIEADFSDGTSVTETHSVMASSGA